MKKRILITGATGYIGRRLKHLLIDRSDLFIRLMVRNREKLALSIQEMADNGEIEIVEADTFNPESLIKALENIDVAFYLIHSMASPSMGSPSRESSGGGKEDNFEARDRESAGNFRDAAIASGVKRIVYLGGLGNKFDASRHLLSRIETGEVLSRYPDRIRTIWFRAGVIIGSGSASFEIIRHIIQKLPVMITPRWVHTRTQPIAIDDVLAYLEAAIHVETDEDLIVDIGSDSMTFRDMMIRTSDIMGLKRFLLPVPFLSPGLSAYWLVLFSPVPFSIASALIEGLKSETILMNDNAGRFFPEIRPVPFEEAVGKAIDEMEQRQVISRWCDSSLDGTCTLEEFDSPDNLGGSQGAVLRDERSFPTGSIPAEKLFEAICSLGGERGWLAFDLLWRIRGVIDKLSGGVGLNRGKRASDLLRIGDAVDFWRVADIKHGRRLLLQAQMMVPGRAWLEFDIRADEKVLVQTAHFHPRGVAGRLYWYSLIPIHHFIFNALGRRVIELAASSRTTV